MAGCGTFHAIASRIVCYPLFHRMINRTYRRLARLLHPRMMLWRVATLRQGPDGQIAISGFVLARAPLVDPVVSIRKFREESVRHDHAVARTPLLAVLGRLLRVVDFQPFSLTLEIPWSRLRPGIYVLQFLSGPRAARLYRKPFGDLLLHPGPDTTVFMGYEPRARALRVEVFDFGASRLEELRRSATRLAGRQGRPIQLLIGEYTHSARDNGRALFDALRAGAPDEQPDISASYVVERTNADGLAIGNDVLAFGSEAHMRYCLDTDVAAHSHDFRNLVPRLVEHIAPARHAAIKSFFIQHGVTALKGSVEGTYRQDRSGADAVAVSSEREASLFHRRFGFPQTSIFTTGFARHDRLLRLARDVKPEDQVLIFPTYRRELVARAPADCRATPYVEMLDALLRATAADGISTTLMLHPLAAHLAPLFADRTRIAVAADFQSELLRHRVLVTDYSSVCFEAVLIGRPVCFLHPPDVQALLKQSYVRIPEDLPGPAFATAAELVASLPRVTAAAPTRRRLYFEYSDDKNCLRLAAAIRSLAA